MKNESGVRMPAEWERNGAVMVAWPHNDTDWAYMMPEVTKCYVELVEAICRHSTVVIVTPSMNDVLPHILSADIDPQHLLWYIVPTNDTWTRDYGPIITTSGSDDWFVNDFKFNGWGLKFAADKDNLVTGRMSQDNFLLGKYINRLGFVLEGGSIESDGKGTIMTTSRCLLSPNRNGDLTREEVEKKLCEYLGASRVLWVNHGYLAGDDTDSHIDTLARLAPNDTILFVGVSDQSDEHYVELAKMKEDLSAFRTAEGIPYHLIELPLPDPIYDEDGCRLPATYANFLILNDAILMPTYGQKNKDELALQIMQNAFPEYKIETIDCRALIRQHGSLHCATMQLPFEVLSLCETPETL